jgi:hypothetical protein
MKKHKRLSKKMDNLKGLTKEVFDILKINPTTKYVIQKTGKSKTSVGKCLNKLLKLGYIERLSMGVYKVIQNQWAVSQVIQNEQEKEIRNKNNLSNSDYYRLHGLEFQLQVPYEIHKQIFNLIFNRKIFTNIRSSGTNKGYYFDVDHSVVTFMVTHKNLFGKFPSDWELTGDSLFDLMESLYDEIKKEVNILQTRYKIPCFKDGKINFNIRKIHIALVNNGIAKEFVKNDINNLVVYDEDDGKPRFIMDMSKLRFELEAVHSKKAFDDVDEAKYFMENLKDGQIRQIIDTNKQIDLVQLTNVVNELSKQVSQMAQGQINTQTQLETLVKVLNIMLGANNLNKDPNANDGSNIDPKDKPYYVG